MKVALSFPSSDRKLDVSQPLSFVIEHGKCSFYRQKVCCVLLVTLGLSGILLYQSKV